MVEEKKKNNNFRNIIIVLMIFVIAIGLMIYIKYPKYKTYEYNGFKFTKAGDMWYTEVQKQGTNQVYRLELRYDPENLWDVPVNDNPKEFLNTLKTYNLTATYITFDTTAQNMSYVALTAADISTNLAKVLGITSIAACTRNETAACSSRPIITCADQSSMVIYIKESNQSRITYNDNCLIVEGKEEGLIKAENKLLLMWYNIIK